MSTKFITSEFENISWITHGFFTRIGGVSSSYYTSLNCSFDSEDSVKNIVINRERVAGELDIDSSKLVFLNQIHGSKTVKVIKPWSFDKAKEADAMVTNKKGIALGITSADGIPLLLADNKERIIGAAHVGWKNSYEGIIKSVISEMKNLGSKVSNIEATIGPCIGFNSYEVISDFKDDFVRQDREYEVLFKPSPREDRFLFNFSGYVVLMLQKTGVKTIYDMQLDTLSNEQKFFSARRAFLKSEKEFGMQASVISIKD